MDEHGRHKISSLIIEKNCVALESVFQKCLLISLKEIFILHEKYISI